MRGLKAPLLATRRPQHRYTQSGWEIFQKIFSQFYIFNALPFRFCFVHGMKNIFYIFADFQISYYLVFFISPSSLSSGEMLLRVVTGHVSGLGMNGRVGWKVWSVLKISTKTWQTLAKINCA